MLPESPNQYFLPKWLDPLLDRPFTAPASLLIDRWLVHVDEIYTRQLAQAEEDAV